MTLEGEQHHGRQMKCLMDPIKVCNSCPCQNCSQRPPAEKTTGGSLLNPPSCPPDDQMKCLMDPIKVCNSCPRQNCSQRPPAEKTTGGSLLNPPSCPPDDPIGQGTELIPHISRRFPIIVIIINPLTARVVGAPQMILQPVFSIFPCSPLPSGTCRTPGLSIP